MNEVSALVKTVAILHDVLRDIVQAIDEGYAKERLDAAQGYLLESAKSQNKDNGQNAPADKSSAQCQCVVKRTEVQGMGIIYARSDCTIHGHLHGAHC